MQIHSGLLTSIQSEGMVKGKALDLMQLRPHDGYDANIIGTADWMDVKGVQRCIYYLSWNSKKTRHE